MYIDFSYCVYVYGRRDVCTINGPFLYAHRIRSHASSEAIYMVINVNCPVADQKTALQSLDSGLTSPHRVS